MTLEDFSKIIDKVVLIIMTACIVIMGANIRMLEKRIDVLQEKFIEVSWKSTLLPLNLFSVEVENEKEDTSN